jgi:hypothetical protein
MTRLALSFLLMGAYAAGAEAPSLVGTWTVVVTPHSA